MPPHIQLPLQTVQKSKEDKWKPIEFPEGFNVDNLITDETKISDRTRTGKSLKKMIKHGLDILYSERFSWFMSEQGCDLDAHITSIDGNKVHLQLVTSLYTDEVSDSDKRDLKDTVRYNIIDDPYQEVNIFEKDGQLAVETTLDFQEIIDVYREVDTQEFMEEFAKTAIEEVVEKVKSLPIATIKAIINRNITTAEENTLFEDVLKNSTFDQLKNTRLTGIASDVGYSKDVII